MDEQRKAREKIAKPQPAPGRSTIVVHPGGVAIMIEIHGKATITVTHAEPPRTARKRETKTRTR